MTKLRLLLFAGFLAACICLPLGVVVMQPTNAGVTSANFERIQVEHIQMELTGGAGITVDCVEQIFGRPSERYDCIRVKRNGPPAEEGIERRDYWTSADGADVVITFLNGKVIGASWSSQPPPSFLSRVQRWLHL